ncbi:glycosyltransferase [uncultured Sphingomonas sp.]|uniref:glycosyltransferase n=1 Tax=uncultured Sphingomonas sp. TaxID=158754 RepID=UPI0030FC319A
MSIYAINLLRQLVAHGHDVVMVSQYYGDPERARVYGGGPPPPVPGVRVVGLEALGEQDGGDFERDVDTMIAAIEREHAAAPFDVLHAQYGYPTGWATLLAARRIGGSACHVSCLFKGVTGIGWGHVATRTAPRCSTC